MAKQNSSTKQLRAQDIYELVSATLQQHFQLDMENRYYDAQDIWDVLIATSVERISIETAVMREVLKGSGFAAYLAGISPNRLSDAEL